MTHIDADAISSIRNFYDVQFAEAIDIPLNDGMLNTVTLLYFPHH